MASTLFALLDRSTAMVKTIASTLDDVSIISVKAAQKTKSIIVDDIATMPAVTSGFDESREVPIVMAIAKGSLFNKVVILTPLILALNFFAPFLIPPLLIAGGLFLCYEAALKSYEMIATSPAAHREEKDEATAIAEAKTIDMILSAEILLIAMSTMLDRDFITQVIALLAVSVLITVLVYGLVLLVVRADDAGLALQRKESTKWIGRFIMSFVPYLLSSLSVIGVVAMSNVGAELLVHATHEIGFDGLYDLVKLGQKSLASIPKFLSGMLIAIPLGFVVGAAILILKKSVLKLVNKQ